MQEQQLHEQPFEGTPETQHQDQEQHFKTLAIRVEESVHAQLHFIAQLGGTSVTEEVRRAIDNRIAAAHEDPVLHDRAEQVRIEIEREAAARTEAITGFMAKRALSTVARAKARRAGKPIGE
jgi:hypothetical protein